MLNKIQTKIISRNKQKIVYLKNVLRNSVESGVVVHSCNPSNVGVWARRITSCWGQPQQLSEILWEKKKKERKKKAQGKGQWKRNWVQSPVVIKSLRCYKTAIIRIMKFKKLIISQVKKTQKKTRSTFYSIFQCSQRENLESTKRKRCATEKGTWI